MKSTPAESSSALVAGAAGVTTVASDSVKAAAGGAAGDAAAREQNSAAGRADTRSALRRGGWTTLLIVAVVYSLLLIYPPLRLLSLLVPSWQPGVAAVLAVALTPLLMRMAHEWFPSLFTRVTSAVALTWLGCGVVMLLVLIPFEVAMLAGLPAALAGMGAATLAALLAVYGMFNAQRLRVRTLDIDGRGKARGTLLQISDVHLGSRQVGLLKRIVGRLQNIPADALLITGDFIDMRHIRAQELQILQQLRMPIYFIIGNHERYVDVDDICERLRKLGVIVLRNDSASLGDFHFLGIDDAERRDQVARHLPALTRDVGRFEVLLYHRPDGFEDAAAANVDLMLCGHTHYGQIVPFNFIVRRIFPRMKGLHRLGDSSMYVSPGTGTWGPVMRLGSRSEITVIRVT